MTGPGEQTEYSTGEKIVNAAGKAVIACLMPIVWLIRWIKPPNWKSKHED